MQLIDGQPVYSARDLVGFLACEHLVHLERAAVGGLVERPKRIDPELDRIAQRGLQHERRFLAGLEGDGKRVTTVAIDKGRPWADELGRTGDETLEAIQGGVDVVYQATLFDGRWLGFADFLVRVDAPSDLGPWSYEAWDTKLARHTKGSAVIQLCLYTDLLARLQGRQPESMHVALGGSARTVDHLRVADYAAYYRLVKAEFEAFVGSGEPTYPPPTRPDPVEHCEVCRWSVECRAWRRANDDLSLVAGISARQRRGLRERDVPTRTTLARLQLPMIPRFEGSSAESLAKVREQARIQVEGEEVGQVLYELLEPSRLDDGTLEPNRGLLSLPEPSPGDLFLDLEGDPFALDDGVDYLFGVLEPGLRDAEGTPTYHAYWSIDEHGEVTPDAEKRAFGQLMDLITDRRSKDPNLHIYHYAAYEATALGRLMGRYGTRETEVDALLRADILVDLFRAVRQGLRASVESYSIKRLEPLYGFEREVSLRDAGSSIVAFETWLELGNADGAGDTGTEQAIAPEPIDGDLDGPADREAIVARIEGYNRDDVVSNWKLRDWLEERRLELAAQIGEPLPRLVPKGEEPSEALSDALAQVQAIADRLTAGVSAERDARTDEEHARWLLAQLLSWHRREEKPAWWRFYYLRDDLTDEERIEEREPLGGLEYVGMVGLEKRSEIFRYRFPPQEHDMRLGTRPIDPVTNEPAGTVVAIDNMSGTIDLKRAAGSAVRHPSCLIPAVVTAGPQRESLLRIGEWVASNGIDAPGPYRAARDLLMGRPPRLGQPPGAGLVRDGEHARDAARRLVRVLDETTLAIQGPPGSGKTSLGAELILDLVAQGKRVGVTANSHKVIGLLLDRVASAAGWSDMEVRIGQKNGQREPCTSPAATCYSDYGRLLDALSGRQLDVAGGTGWVWARDDFTGSVDVLVVDEAGQMSLANTIAMSQAASSLILLGDPQQLDQPLQGTHPPGAGRSALAHILEFDEPTHQTMPADRGLFLDRTWRLHPDICDYTSEVFYESRLEPEPGCAAQRLAGEAPLDGTGIRFIAVDHTGNRNESIEEAEALRALLEELLARGPTWTNAKGEVGSIGLSDILVITPYNAQVRAIAEAIPGTSVGTVDKFQGQQAPISIYSMATSSAEEAPRGMEFLYSLNRLNVATSRARCLTAVVASPDLVRVRCRTPRQMELANALARLLEMAREQEARR